MRQKRGVRFRQMQVLFGKKWGGGGGKFWSIFTLHGSHLRPQISIAKGFCGAYGMTKWGLASRLQVRYLRQNIRVMA